VLAQSPFWAAPFSLVPDDIQAEYRAGAIELSLPAGQVLSFSARLSALVVDGKLEERQAHVLIY